jgi:serine/threonine protein kinase
LGSLADWEVIKQLGAGGQSKVSLVRTPKRRRERESAVKVIRTLGQTVDWLHGDQPGQLADAVWSYSRPESPAELAALKQFNIEPERRNPPPPPDSPEHEAIQRLKNEISVLQEGHFGLPRLLDFNEPERWIVTEYFDLGTLEDNPSEYRGEALRALNAFKTIVSTVQALHERSYVHRDIKPPNVFLAGESKLVLGDFGIVYSPSATRVTRTGEKVGPRDYMPPWAHVGRRVEDVQPCWDIYMLGKLLWCMVDGRSFLPREYFQERDFDLTRTFLGDPGMHLINGILAKCLVERSSECLSSARLLLMQVEEAIGVLTRGGQIVSKDTPRFCRVCGRGVYQPTISENSNVIMQLYFVGNLAGSDRTPLPVRPFSCTACGHIQFFRPV